MPFYIICDTSGSMNPYMNDLNKAVAELLTSITSDPVVDGMVMLSIISFGTKAEVDVSLGYASEITSPTLSLRGGTNYGAALSTYGEAVKADYARLKAGGSKFFRPCVFFLTDGQPGDQWEKTYNDVVRYDPDTKQGNNMYPTIVAYGFGEADEATLRKLAYPNFGPDEKRGKAFITKSKDVPALLKEIASAIGSSVVSSGQSGTGGGTPKTIVPQEAEGMQTLEPEEDIF
jgi:uncharacterized protein YegL